MISGYRGTIRDVPVSMDSAEDTVSGRFLAYTNGNQIRTYAFTYTIRDGEIIHAEQRTVTAGGRPGAFRPELPLLVLSRQSLRGRRPATFAPGYSSRPAAGAG